jgi:transposase-like protein
MKGSGYRKGGSRKRYSPESIIGMLREAELCLAQGMTVGQICRQLSISEQAYYSWRKQYGGLKIRSRLDAGQSHFKRGFGGKLLSPDRRRKCIEHLQQKLGISERRACRAIGQPRSTQRYNASRKTNQESLRSDIIGLATKYGRYGYRRITALLRGSGWRINHKRVERIWRQRG